MAEPRTAEGPTASGAPAIAQRRRGRLGIGIRVERRAEPRFIGLYRLIAIGVGLVVALLVAPLLGSTPASEFYDVAWTGTLGSALGFGNVLTIAIPLAIAGLAASIPYRLGLWNIGIDGQILMGAWLALAVSRAMPDLAGPVLIPMMLVAGMLGGAVWILGPALARVYLGLNEIVTTFLLNFVAIAWLTYWVTGPWRDPVSQTAGGIRSEPIPKQTELGLLDLGDVVVHSGIVIAVALPLAAWLTIRFTRVGYEITMSGASERAGRYAGIPVTRRLIAVMLVGGALGGLAGVIDMLGTLHQYGTGLTNNTGFSAVVIAVLAGGSELAVPVMAFIYAVLVVGGDAVGLTGVSPDIVFAMVGITLLLATTGDALARFRPVRTRVRDARSTGSPHTPDPRPQLGTKR